MSINGIWKVEMLSPYGWEAMSTAFLQDGRYWSGGANQYAVGSYTLNGDKVISEATVVIHGEKKTFLGKTENRYMLRFDGELAGNTITGSATDSEGIFLVRHRATKLADLP
jgi:hypothetical protein